nr:MAG TPA: hypothetical protein [Caudoviricetes sp.]
MKKNLKKLFKLITTKTLNLSKYHKQNNTGNQLSY